MATVNREIAEQIIERAKAQKRPKVYCVIEYENVVFNRTNYAYFEDKDEYLSAIQGQGAGTVKVLWSSPRFEKDRWQQYQKIGAKKE